MAGLARCSFGRSLGKKFKQYSAWTMRNSPASPIGVSAQSVMPAATLLSYMPCGPTAPKIERNEPCPCGSQRKFKKCRGSPGSSNR
jgi:hypothetical protein